MVEESGPPRLVREMLCFISGGSMSELEMRLRLCFECPLWEWTLGRALSSGSGS